MIKLWDIKLYQKKKGKYKVEIVDSYGKKFVGQGQSAHGAYEDCLCKMVYKPWLESRPM